MTALMLAPAFFSLLGMAALGSPAVATLGEIAAKAKSRVFTKNTASKPPPWA